MEDGLHLLLTWFCRARCHIILEISFPKIQWFITMFRFRYKRQFWGISHLNRPKRHMVMPIAMRHHWCAPIGIILWYQIYRIYQYTSSTAQGGGGSFKNRKPIGEVGCCESGMAERSHWLTERWLELCLLEWLQWLQWSPHPQLLDVVWCTATVVVVVA